MIRTLLPALLLLAACSTPYPVQADHDPDADFSQLRTYAWFPGPQPQVGDPWVDDPRVDTSIRRAIEAELMREGFEKTPRGVDPDFYVAYAASMNDKLDIAPMKDRYGPANWSWAGRPMINDPSMGDTPSSTFTESYQEGTILLDVVNPETSTPIWRGAVNSRTDLNASTQDRLENLQNAVDHLLDDFPPKG